MRTSTADGVLATLFPALAASLDGSGPAVLPLPAGGNRELVEAMRPDVPLDAEGVAVVVPTSGSTGVPKGVLLRRDALLHSAAASYRRIGGPGQWVLTLPVSHVAGVSVLVRSLVAGTRPEIVDLQGGFDVRAFAAATARLSDNGRRYCALVPTQLHRLLDAGIELTSYDAVLVGGAAVPQHLLARAAEAGAPVVVTYGMSETCGGCVYDGIPLDGVQVSISSDHRISIAGPVLFSGYRLRPDLSADALVEGRHLTNDLGRWTDTSRLEVLGRRDDVIISGGVNVEPSRVEQVLSRHPGIHTCVVVSRDDAEWGERVVAVVQPQNEHAVPTLQNLQDLARADLEPAALPREIVVLDTIPLLRSGKPDRAEVRSLVAGSRPVRDPAALPT